VFGQKISNKQRKPKGGGSKSINDEITHASNNPEQSEEIFMADWRDEFAGKT